MRGTAEPAATAPGRPAAVPAGAPELPGARAAAGPVIEAAALASGYHGRTVVGADSRARRSCWSTGQAPAAAASTTTRRRPAARPRRHGGGGVRRGGTPRCGAARRRDCAATLTNQPPANASSAALIGYVPQRRTLDPDLGVRAADLVGLGVDGHRWGMGVKPRKRQQKAEDVSRALASVGAAHLGGRAVGRLSGGEQQRLQLAQALVARPQLLLLDEPLASLDLRSQQEVSQLVADLRAEYGFTVVLVTHDINPVLGVTDRVMYVAGGGVSVGPPEEVITSASLSRLYQAEVEVLTDSRGRVFVVGLEAETAHPHSPRGPRP